MRILSEGVNSPTGQCSVFVRGTARINRTRPLSQRWATNLSSNPTGAEHNFDITSRPLHYPPVFAITRSLNSHSWSSPGASTFISRCRMRMNAFLRYRRQGARGKFYTHTVSLLLFLGSSNHAFVFPSSSSLFTHYYYTHYQPFPLLISLLSNWNDATIYPDPAYHPFLPPTNPLSRFSADQLELALGVAHSLASSVLTGPITASCPSPSFTGRPC